MKTAADTAVLAEAYPSDWPGLARGHNLLIEGPSAATRPMLRLLESDGPGPMVILEDVAALTPEEQAELLVRLDRQESRPRVVAATDQSLFALVTRGAFDAALYYRLNVVLLRVGASDTSD